MKRDKISDVLRNWPPSEVDTEIWLNSADSSYVAARMLYREFTECNRAVQLPAHSTFLQDDIFYAFHLAIEKYLKAYLIHQACTILAYNEIKIFQCIENDKKKFKEGKKKIQSEQEAVNFQLTHDLKELVRRCVLIDQEFKELQKSQYMSILKFLSSFVDRRYVSNIGKKLTEPPTKSSDVLRDLCDKIVCFVRNKIDLGDRLENCLLNKCMNPQYYQNYREFKRIKDVISEQNKSIKAFKFS